MKTTLLLLFVMTTTMLQAQNSGPHQPAAPPVNPTGSFNRGMFIDCSDQLIDDLINQEQLGLRQELINYIQTNYITYVAMDGLQSVIGNPFKEQFLKRLLNDLHRTFPDLLISAVVRNGVNVNARFFKTSDVFKLQCGGADAISRNQIDSLLKVNADANAMIRFLVGVSKLNETISNGRTTTKCSAAFDGFYLQYRYWEQLNLPLSQMQSNFSTFIAILKTMQQLKCNFSCLKNIEAELLPTEAYSSQGWTATDQITEADFLIDRMIIPGFTYDANGVYTYNKQTIHLLDDRFTKARTRYMIGMSAERSTLPYCSGIGMAADYLGDYLNQSGNMYSVEKLFIEQLNDPNFQCQFPNCNMNAWNQYSPTNPFGNELIGSLWFTYSFLKAGQVNRVRNENKEKETNSLRDFDLLGRQLK